MPTIQCDDINFYYERHGQGAPVILIAGYTCDHLFWSGLVNALAVHSEVLIFDNRAIGRTKDSRIPFSIETMADDVMKLSNMLELKAPSIIGQSMGGATAQTVAKKYSDQINKLVIINSTMKFNAVSMLALKNILAMRKLDIPFDLIMEASLPWVVSSDYLEDADNIASFKQAVASNPYPQSIEDQTRQFTALAAFDSRNWANQIHNPSLVIASSHDTLVPVAESEALAKNHPCRI